MRVRIPVYVAIGNTDGQRPPLQTAMHFVTARQNLSLLRRIEVWYNEGGGNKKMILLLVKEGVCYVWSIQF